MRKQILTNSSFDLPKCPKCKGLIRKDKIGFTKLLESFTDGECGIIICNSCNKALMAYRLGKFLKITRCRSGTLEGLLTSPM